MYGMHPLFHYSITVLLLSDKWFLHPAVAIWGKEEDRRCEIFEFRLSLILHARPCEWQCGKALLDELALQIFCGCNYLFGEFPDVVFHCLEISRV